MSQETEIERHREVNEPLAEGGIIGAKTEPPMGSIWSLGGPARGGGCLGLQEGTSSKQSCLSGALTQCSVISAYWVLPASCAREASRPFGWKRA